MISGFDFLRIQSLNFTIELTPLEKIYFELAHHRQNIVKY
jgi:hypothetical protein